MRFSIVIPTHQRREIVRRSVTALEGQSFRDFEAIVVVDGSTDGTASALRSLAVTFPLTVIEREREGAAIARNAGSAAARGELLVFLDDDMEADPGMLAEHDRSHREGADLVVGHLPLHPDSPETLLSQGVARWAEKRRKRLEDLGPEVPVTELNTGQMSVSREAFLEMGGFDVSFTREGLYGGEDFDFGYRAGRSGMRVVFNPAAISHQYYAVDPAAYTRRTREAGRAARRLKTKHPELTQDLRAGLEFTTRRSRLVFGALSHLPSPLSRPLRALAAGRVRAGHLDMRTYRLFFALQTMEFQRGFREGGRPREGRGAIVLAYHAVADLRHDPLLREYGVPPARFAAQLEDLLRRNWTFIDLTTLLGALSGEHRLPRRAIVLTFDDAYVDLLSDACPVLAERRLPAVAFAVTGRLGGTNEWDRPHGAGTLALLDARGLLTAASKGVDVGSHGATHRRLTELAPPELEQEVAGSAAALVEIGLPRPLAFSYPYGVWNAEVAASIRDAGYRAAFTVEAGVARPLSNRYALPRVEVFASDTPRLLRVKLATAGWPAGPRRRLLRLLGGRP